jgi:two-component system chemotaxis sensor kinase CheA
MHNIKGNAGFLGFTRLEALAHAAEGLLTPLRDGRLPAGPETVAALLAAVDAARRMLARIETARDDGTDDHAALIATLQRLQTGGDANSPPSPAAAPAGPAPSPAANGSDAAVDDVLAADAVLAAVADNTVRVDVALLDKLMNLVGELVLVRNQILRLTADGEDSVFGGSTQHLNLITTELQEGVMRTRMQPIGNVWTRFPRMVRDLAAACGKRVRIEMEGEDTELDRTILEAVRDPLTHLVRNAVDHGIEPPSVRVSRGKPAEGRISLRAYHEGGKVNIEIADDGGGIDADRVRDKALAAGLITAEQAARMSARELTGLIFLPGFSTAERVTNVSGRGVGMDVVRSNIERIGGTVDVRSRPGGGTTVEMKIPLTLAIIPALTVTSGGDRYAIPQVSLLELVRLEGEQVHRGIEMIHGAPVYRLRGRLLPLVYLDRELTPESQRHTTPTPTPTPTGPQKAAVAELNIVVLQVDDRQFGLVVDAIHDTEEIVVKPLQKRLKGLGVFAGATIMGDGRVALILDVLGLAQRANVVTGARERTASERADAAAGPAAASAARHAMLLLGDREGGRQAIPLPMVSRLEELPRSAVERMGGQDVVQYRGEILPLVHLSDFLSSGADRSGGAPANPASAPAASASSDPLKVVVHSGEGRSVGLVVDRILDIVEEEIAVRSRAARRGVRFSAVVQGRVTEVLDIPAIVGAAAPAFAEQSVPTTRAAV